MPHYKWLLITTKQCKTSQLKLRLINRGQRQPWENDKGLHCISWITSITKKRLVIKLSKSGENYYHSEWYITHQDVTWDSEIFRCFSLSLCWNMASPSLVLSMFQPIVNMLFSDSLTGQRYVSLSWILNTQVCHFLVSHLCTHQSDKHLNWKQHNSIIFNKTFISRSSSKWNFTLLMGMWNA